ncbi:hypothetical protein SH449x_004796 [Pirellulaceae bacterium SH449]
MKLFTHYLSYSIIESKIGERFIRFRELTDGAVSDNVADRSADPLLPIPVIPTKLGEEREGEESAVRLQTVTGQAIISHLAVPSHTVRAHNLPHRSVGGRMGTQCRRLRGGTVCFCIFVACPAVPDGRSYSYSNKTQIGLGVEITLAL